MEAKKNKKKKKDVQIADNNLLVQDLKRDDWVKNPVAYAQIRGDFTLMESNLMVNLVGALQDRINGYLKRKQMGVEQTDSLFTEEELNKGEIKIEIPLTDDSFHSFICLRGEGTLSLNGEVQIVKAGDSIFMPARNGLLHISGNLAMALTKI